MPTWNAGCRPSSSSAPAAAAEREQRIAESAALAERQKELAAARAEALAQPRPLLTQSQSLRQQLAEMETQLKTGRAALDQLREDRAGRSSELAKLRSDLEYLEASCLTEVNVEAQVLRADTEIVRLAAKSWPPRKRPAAHCASASSRWARST